MPAGRPNVARDDLLAAVEFANEFNLADAPFRLADFSLRYLGRFTVKELERFDDIGAWLDIRPGDGDGLTRSQQIEELYPFRGRAWAERARTWLRVGIPPIVVVEFPDEEGRANIAIGDGRGRVNVAALTGRRVPVYQLTYRGLAS